MTIYGDDVAYVHDVAFSAFCEAATPFIRALVRERGSSQRVVELGCAGGRLAKVLADDGHQVTGVDVSSAMIRIARRRVPKARFVRGSALDTKLPRADVVVALSEIFNYLLEPRGLHRVLARIREALVDDGVLLFDVSGPSSGPPEDREVARSGKDWAIFTHVYEDDRKRTITRDVSVFRRVGRTYRRSDEQHVQRLWSPRDVEAILRRLGFAVRTRRGYGALRFTRHETAFLARRKGTDERWRR